MSGLRCSAVGVGLAPFEQRVGRRFGADLKGKEKLKHPTTIVTFAAPPANNSYWYEDNRDLRRVALQSLVLLSCWIKYMDCQPPLYLLDVWCQSCQYFVRALQNRSAEPLNFCYHAECV